MQNKLISIDSKLEAWLSFLSSDDPEIIVSVINQYPEFKPLYKDIYKMCQNTKHIMRLFSEELEIMDNNTVQLMIDEQARQITEHENLLAENRKKLDDLNAELAQSKAALIENEKELAQSKAALAESQEKNELLRKRLADAGLL